MGDLLLSLAITASLLSADDWATREAAERTLRAAGPIAYPFLAAQASSSSPEARDRAIRLLAPLRRSLSEAEALTWLNPGEPLSVAAVIDLHNNPITRHRLAATLYRMRLLSVDEAEYMAEAHGWTGLWCWIAERESYYGTLHYLTIARLRAAAIPDVMPQRPPTVP